MSDNPSILKESYSIKAKVPSSWNVAAEVLKREHGFIDSFPQNCYSSRYIVERMRLSQQLTKQSHGPAAVINFNCRGDLICAACNSNSDNSQSRIELIDWARSKTKAEIVVQNAGRVSDVDFLNLPFQRDEINIVSASENGLIRHDAVTPTGQAILKQTRQLPTESYKLAKCAGREHEVLSAAASGIIYGIDLRCDAQAAPTLLAQTKPVGKFVKLQAMSHHPLAPHICAAYSDFNVRIFDKRKFERPLHEICPNHLLQSKAFASYADCAYSFDGSEILATFASEKIFLFDSENKNAGKFKQAFSQRGLVGYYNKSSFFGTKSECIIVGDDSQSIRIFNKVTGKCENSIDLQRVADFRNTEFLALKSHPNLPIVAASLEVSGLSIISPASEKMKA